MQEVGGSIPPGSTKPPPRLYASAEDAGVNPIQAVLLWPGMAFMDWVVQTFPLFVIRTGFGFWAESYLFWSAVTASVFWLLVVAGLLSLVRRRLRRGQQPRGSARFG